MDGDIKLWTRGEYDQYQEKMVQVDTKFALNDQKHAADVAMLQRADQAIISAADKLTSRVTAAEKLAADMVGYDKQVEQRLQGLTSVTNDLKQADTSLNSKVSSTASDLTKAIQAGDQALSIRLRPLEDTLPGLRSEIQVLQGRCDKVERANADNVSRDGVQDTYITALTKRCDDLQTLVKDLQDRLTKLEKPTVEPAPVPPVVTEPVPPVVDTKP